MKILVIFETSAHIQKIMNSFGFTEAERTHLNDHVFNVVAEVNDGTRKRESLYPAVIFDVRNAKSAVDGEKYILPQLWRFKSLAVYRQEEGEPHVCLSRMRGVEIKSDIVGTFAAEKAYMGRRGIAMKTRCVSFTYSEAIPMMAEFFARSKKQTLMLSDQQLKSMLGIHMLASISVKPVQQALQEYGLLLIEIDSAHYVLTTETLLCSAPEADMQIWSALVDMVSKNPDAVLEMMRERGIEGEFKDDA